MNAFYLVKLYLITVPIFFIIDIIWLGYVARGFYRNNLAGFLSPNINWKAAIIFYLIYIAGILIFSVIPALEADSLQKAVIWGALFGFFTYATYDLTNMATLNNWPLKIVLFDILWGTFLGSAVSALSFFGGRWIA